MSSLDALDSTTLDLKKHIRGIPNFPKPGILFYDIGTLLAHGPAWEATVGRLANVVRAEKPDVLLGIESRGFLMGAPVAALLGIGFVMVRKKGKLPGQTASYTYDLEYGSDTIEIQEGILQKGQRAVLIDDLLATGGTASAATSLARQMGAVVTRAAFVVELTFLPGRQKLESMDLPVSSLVTYDTEAVPA